MNIGYRSYKYSDLIAFDYILGEDALIVFVDSRGFVWGGFFCIRLFSTSKSIEKEIESPAFIMLVESNIGVHFWYA
jgi:hypothetical protein